MRNLTEIEAQVSAKYMKQQSVEIPRAKVTLHFEEGGRPAHLSVLSDIESMHNETINKYSHLRQAHGDFALDPTYWVNFH